MENKRIFLSPPHMSGNEQKYVNQAFEQNWIAPLGPNVDAFEHQIAEYIGVKSAAAVSAGTAAIHLALQLLGVNRDDTVFCSSLTFAASANPIAYQGAEPIFIDSEPDTWNMSPVALRKAFEDAKASGKFPKAVIVVHLFGQSAKMDEIMDVCDKYGVLVVEDSAESLGTTYKGKQTGSFGKFGIFSFNGNKIITTSGGGMLVSNDEVAIQKARFLSTQARDPAVHYEHSHIGYNYRMSNIVAGVGRAQLEVLNNRVQARRDIFTRYKTALGELPGITFMPEFEDAVPNRWLSTLLIDEKVTGVTYLDVIEALAAQNIEARPVWKPLHRQPVFAGSKYYTHGDTDSISDKLFSQGLCLPSGSSMTVEDQERVIATVKEVLAKQVVTK
ncbi:aminotransferase class I/II-fold pyridoxal phosphate-dependent enzyme [Bacillus pseudomycoides]|uniref:aminotransferase class I/II-fold pyridoxal phosphate-dependent enzyme n=1 Tax=Bacillus pseudomycoides TaxID=64104 RepID=UPI000BED7FF7|nr:aminotransferase class I/II-fold pyridoxal phosphate-dependent enzyme [Bacillus pseudomycoides]PEB42765.1 pyridoxal phosphate-dependent aminotransferase [Bacillus pseudomycoides]PGD96081.1 pyridoxal phosphate-dependent aminotransferase [Bacillus pseudomycoides]PGE06057.1 pyridoxal phosphate-dependent aminotransferase [Bacillus pseudomycoides]PHE72642.1 pyridoxal phosphate-dependent aminotransferase [Bacillus pseudomycoides]PHG21282.1 pyridoxal phosphate-dependent aminotransferase [Bacillus 